MLQNKRISFIGSHGVGKGWLLENISKKYKLTPQISFVSTYWEMIKKEKIREISLFERYLQQYVLVVRGFNSYFENDGGLFERSPLDILAYTKLLLKDIETSYWNKELDISQWSQIQVMHERANMQNTIFEMCDEFVDMLIYVPVRDKILEKRGEQTDYRELKSNCKTTAAYMVETLTDYFDYDKKSNSSKRRTAFINLNCEVNNRMEIVTNSLQEVMNGKQFVHNGENILVR